MGKKLPASLLIASLLTLAISTGLAHDGEVTIERVVSVTEYGLVYVDDRIVNAPLGVKVGLSVPAELGASPAYIEVQGGEVVGQEKSREAQYYFLLLSSPGGVLVRQVYKGLVSQVGESSYELRAPGAPLVTGLNYTYELRVVLPQGSQPGRKPEGFIQNGSTLLRRGSGGDAVARQVLDVGFSSTDLRLIAVERLEIAYDLDAEIVTAWLKIRNDDRRGLLSVTLNLPGGLRAVDAGDHSGQLRYRVSGGRVTVDIYPERYELKSGWRYEFYLRASMDKGSGLAAVENGVVRVRSFIPLDAPINVFTINTVLPHTLFPRSADLFTEIYRDPSGRVVARIRDELLNPYRLDAITFEVDSSGMPPIVPQALVLTIIVIWGALGVITYAGATRAVRSGQKTAMTPPSQRVLRDLMELRAALEEVDTVASLRGGDAKEALIQQAMARLKSKYEALLSDLGSLRGGVQTSRALGLLQRRMSELGESLRILSRSYRDFQRGEMSRAGYLKIYRALRGDIREFIAAISEIEDAVKSLSEKT